MSELIITQQAHSTLRWRFLTTVSSFALLASACGMRSATAEGSDQPTVWIELGADLERVDGGQQGFAPAFIANNPGSTAFDPVSPLQAEKPPRFSFGDEAKFIFQPSGSDWAFSASVQYGRSNGNRHVHQSADNKLHYSHLVFVGPHHSKYHVIFPPTNRATYDKNFLDVTERQSESHAVVDFQAGKDVGLGLFGREGTFVLNGGVRFAQFTSRMESSLKARPDLVTYAVHGPIPRYPHDIGTIYAYHYHQYVATGQSARSFRGIGPSLSWNASTPFAGSREDGELSVDWGANAAILFGRQKASVQHQSSAVYSYRNKYPRSGAGYDHPLVNQQRARTVTVPNVGGFAGVSIRTENFKVALGYRGDFFFGAMDTGFDTAKHSTIGFYGPFATISVGLGG